MLLFQNPFSLIPKLRFGNTVPEASEITIWKFMRISVLAVNEQYNRPAGFTEVRAFGMGTTACPVSF